MGVPHSPQPLMFPTSQSRAVLLHRSPFTVPPPGVCLVLSFSLKNQSLVLSPLTVLIKPSFLSLDKAQLPMHRLADAWLWYLPQTKGQGHTGKAPSSTMSTDHVTSSLGGSVCLN